MSVSLSTPKSVSLAGLELVPELGGEIGAGTGVSTGAATGGAAGGPAGAVAGGIAGYAYSQGLAQAVADPAANASGWDLVLDPAKRGGLTLAQAYSQLFSDAGSLAWRNDNVGAEGGRYYPIDAQGDRYPDAPGWSYVPVSATLGHGAWEFWALPQWREVGGPELTRWRDAMRPQVDPASPTQQQSQQYLTRDPRIDMSELGNNRRSEAGVGVVSSPIRATVAAQAQDARRRRAIGWALGLAGVGVVVVLVAGRKARK